MCVHLCVCALTCVYVCVVCMCGCACACMHLRVCCVAVCLRCFRLKHTQYHWNGLHPLTAAAVDVVGSASKSGQRDSRLSSGVLLFCAELCSALPDSPAMQ